MTGDGTYRSGFATLVGRPNVGKSTLLNAVLGQKVSITSPVAQTTRNQVRGVLTRPGLQIVFVDTPGIHKPRTLLGARLNDTANDALAGVDVTVLVLDATQPLGRGDRFVADLVPPSALCVVNKVDAAPRRVVLDQLQAAAGLGLEEYFPVSARTGEGVGALLEAIVTRVPEGPQLYPDDMVTDVPEAHWVAELVREQLLAVTREEVPHSIACRVTEWEWPRVRCEVLVERESQKPIVIGRGGSVLKEVGTRVRAQLPPGAYLELFVKVDPGWQSRPKALERLGY
ncbi:GTPase Era [Acidimicrobiaceae bacterium USS-CC1]|uniref:GTPase Era n=1 Tax=Acidiferrimicrobium australe TaxID=2664430 RepID=A0ABW9QR07_9ACTN|nr:GTPase Era [Acidiferrimicrobium australe]